MTLWLIDGIKAKGGEKLLVEKERIEEAKEKLGDENAFIMAELLELEKFDEKNLKACCPYHNEDTASFIYNKKDRRFHCFAKETRVITDDGIKQISEIIDKSCQVFNGNGKLETTVFRNCGKQKLLKLSLIKNARKKEMYVTPEHEWIIKGKEEKVQTKDLVAGQVLASIMTVWSDIVDHEAVEFIVDSIEETDREEDVYCCETSTHSFVLADFILTGNCFGCNATVDIIDVLVESGKTFLEAVQYLFDKAGITYSFGEKDVKTKRDYRYPHEEPIGEKKKVIEYWGKRGISKEVLDYLDVREDAHGNGVFNFYDTNDVLTMVKYRPARTVEKHSGEPKTWCQKDADTAHLLFNMNRVNTSKPLLICEGETDCASAIESSYLNTVSVPLGAGNTHWIEENWDWLNEFEEIIIWSDNDESGIKMRKDCVYRLGTWRTKYISTPDYFEKENGKKIRLNDINDCLQAGGKEFVLSLISEAKDVPIKSVVDYSTIEELDISQMDGVQTGVKPLDDELLKIFYGTLTILTGRPGSGKTSLIDQSIASSIDNGNPVFLFSKEMPERMSANWFNTILAGRRNLEEKTTRDGKKYYIVPKTIQQRMQEYYKEKLLMYKDDEPNDIDSVMQSAEECVRKYGAKLIVLDNLMMLDLECAEADKNTAQTNLINRLIKFAAKFNVAVVLIAHPKKTPDSNAEINMYDISGSSNIINLAMRSIGLRRVSKREKDDPKSAWGKYDVVLTVIKDRLLGKADFQMGLWYDFISRRFYTDYEEYDTQFAWDDNKYSSKMPFKDRSAPENIFPDK